MISFAVQHVPNAFRYRAHYRAWLSRVAKHEGRTIVVLNYVLLTDKELLRFNRRYLGHNEYTDIITFDTRDPLIAPPRSMSPRAQPRGIYGDILISYDRVKENARTFNVPAQHELRRVMVHGLLHLCGHNDKSPKQQKAMRALEDTHLARW